MKYFESINSHKYIFLGDIREPEDNSLHLIIKEAGVSDEEESLEIADTEISGLRAIEVTDKSRIYKVVFESYIGYSVIDESYAIPDDYEVFEGRIFCVYSKSHYLDYISKASFASSEHPGPFKHYGFNCLNHIVDVVSTEEPKIKLVSGRHLTKVPI